MKHFPTALGKNLLHALLLHSVLCLATTLYAFTWDDSDNGFLVNDEIKRAAEQATQTKYPDADVVLIDSAIKIQYQADGKSLQVADDAYKIMTLKGVDSMRILPSYYDASYSRAKISLVQLIKSNGEVVTLDLATCTQEMVDDSSMSKNIYDVNDRVIKVTVANLQPGDILRTVYVDEILKPRIPNSFSDIELFEATMPIVHKKVTIDAPQALPLRSIIVKDPQNGGPRHREVEEGDRKIYIWEAGDVAQVFPEPSAPNLSAYLQRVVVSTFASWEEVSRWYSSVSEPHLALNEEIQDGVQSLTADCQTDEEKILAIYNFVSQKIRYMGLVMEDTAPGYEPHDVTITFQQRAGVCRDMAALLVAMLRAAGYEAHPTLIHVGPAKDMEVPIPYFNHAITAIKDPKTGDWRLMDATPSNVRDPFPSYLSDKSYLVATPEGDPLRLSPVRPYQENLLTIHSTGRLNEDGSLNLTTGITFNGISDNVYRNFFLGTKPEQHRMFFEHQLATAVPGALLTRLQITPADLQDLTDPLQVQISYQVPKALITDQNSDGSADLTPGKYAMLRFPRLSGAFGLNLMIFGRATLDKRRFPLDAGTTTGVTEDLEIDIPENLTLVGIPQYSNIDTPQFSLARTFESQPGRMAVHALYASKVMRYSPEEYLQLKSALAQKDTDDRKMAIFRINDPLPTLTETDAVKNDRPDLKFENYSTVITIHSPTSWTVERSMKYTVMTYAGIESADRHFQFNPVWEDIEILTARVTTNGITQDTPPENINIMDEEWVASAPRYPAGKILVLNLPGVEIGSTVEIQYQQTFRDRPFFYYGETVRKEHPIQNWSLGVIAKGKGIDLVRNVYSSGWLNMSDDLDTPVYIKQDVNKFPDDLFVYSFSAKDVPAYHQETSLPPPHSFLPTVILTNGNWKIYANTLKSYVEAIGNGDDTLAEIVEPMRLLPKEECITEIRAWIEKNIRDTAPDFCDLPLNYLSAPEVTLKDGYGNSADKAILYHAMLAKAGIPSQIFLAADTPQMRELKLFRQKHPADSFFRDWLVLVKLNGKEIWLNDQTQYGQFGTCVFDHGMRLSLDNGHISDIELPAAYKDESYSEMTLKVLDDGSAILSVRNNISGDSFGAMKRYYDRLTPEERKRHYQGIVSGISQDAQPITPDLTTSFRTYPGFVSYEVSIKNCATIDGDFCYLKLPISLAESVGFARAKRQFHPLYQPNYQKKTITLDVTLPKNFPNEVLVPANYRWIAPDNAGVINWQHQASGTQYGTGKRLRFTLSVDLKPSVMTLRLYDKYQEAYQYLQHPASTILLLSK